jgi:hypothetical protein
MKRAGFFAGQFLLLAFALGMAGCSGDSGSGGSALVSILNTTVSGKIQYEDREYDRNGFTTVRPPKAVRFALVEVVETSNSLPVATGATDADGNYSINFSYIGTGSVYARVITSTALHPGGPDIRVYNTGNLALYSVAGSSFPVQSNGVHTADITVAYDSMAGGAYNIMDVMTTGSQFINSLAGAYPPATLKVYWQKSRPIGTRYCTGYDFNLCPRGEGIYVLSGVLDTDEFDDDVLWHEYAHFVARTMSKDDSLGGMHTLENIEMDLRLSWSEGWGDFFPGAVKQWLYKDLSRSALLSFDTTEPMTYYVDTDEDPSTSPGPGNIYISFDFGNPPAAIARVLHALESAFNGSQGIWNVVEDYLPYISTPVNLEAFWDGFLGLPSPYTDDISALETIFSERRIHYKHDAFEAADDDAPNLARMAVLGASETHYLYNTSGAPDVDYVAFEGKAGKTYHIEAYCLKNGADTKITLLGNSVSPPFYPFIDEDDDNEGFLPQDLSCMGNYLAHASVIEYYATISNVYYVGIEKGGPPDKPYAGRYGTYDLKVTEQ